MHTLTFTQDARSQKALRELRELTGAASNAELLRRALTLLKMAQQTTTAGGQFVLRGPTGSETRILI